MQFSFETSLFSKCCVVIGIAILLWVLIFGRSGQVNKPCVNSIALPASHVEVDQKTTQVQVFEKPFEVGFDVFGGQYNSKYFYGGRVVFRYKF